METVLELRGVSKKFDDDAPVVDDVWLSLRRGELHSLLGPSGCGKTTILRLIAGFEQPTAGEIHLNGSRLDVRPPFERPVTTVFQNYALFPHMTVRGNIEFGLKQKNMDSIAARVARVLDLVQMSGMEERFPAQLSGGQRQRVALARSLALEPEVLLLDEPLSALDPNLRKQVRGELRALQRRVGTTFLMVTHDQEEALSLSDRITVIEAGKVRQIGTPEEVYLRPASRFVAGFLGAVNWINGVGVRPEATHVSHQAPPPNGHRVVGARVANAVFLGDCFHVETMLESGESVVAQVSRLNGRFERGENVHVWWHPGDEIAL
jgi:spermidine/putrescine transport system ATP-binding protein